MAPGKQARAPGGEQDLVDFHIAKPFNPTRLADAIHRVAA
jgi:hypothetical protein